MLTMEQIFPVATLIIGILLTETIGYIKDKYIRTEKKQNIKNQIVDELASVIHEIIEMIVIEDLNNMNRIKMRSTIQLHNISARIKLYWKNDKILDKLDQLNDSLLRFAIFWMKNNISTKILKEEVGFKKFNDELNELYTKIRSQHQELLSLLIDSKVAI